MKLPDKLLDGMEIRVDEKDAKIYFIYGGNYGNEVYLLSLPMPLEK